MRKFIWPMVGLSSILIVVVGFVTGIVSVTPQKREIAVPLSAVSLQGDSEMKLDEMLDLISGLSNQIIGLKEREAKGASVGEDVKRLQSEIAKLRDAIEALTVTALEEKEPTPAPPPTDSRNEELEAKVKALERKVKRLSKSKVEEPKALPAPPPPPIVTATEVYSPPCRCNTTMPHQVVHRRSGFFGLGILGRGR